MLVQEISKQLPLEFSGEAVFLYGDLSQRGQIPVLSICNVDRIAEGFIRDFCVTRNRHVFQPGI